MTDAWLKALILGCTFGAVLLLVEVLVGWMANSRSEGRAINLRLRMIAEGRDREQTMSLLRRRDSALPTGLPPLLKHFGQKFERMLVAAQVTIPTGRLMLMILIAPIAIFFAILLVMALLGIPVALGRIVMIGTFAVVVGAFLPLMFLQFKANRTRKKMQDQFPTALDVFVRGLRAGHPIAAALDLLTVEMPDPIGSQFGVVVDEVTYGAELRDALQAMADRWDLEDMRMFVVSLSVQSETGGNLAEILDNLSTVIRERHSMYLKVRALSSEGRMTAIMLTVLPVFAFAMLFLMNPSFYLDVADDPAFMPSFLGLILMYVIGFITIRKMVDLKV
ncbi:type II secretion system F family protein [Sphingomonas sediminicola]|jgi:tight adherence protein B|uniref:Type II secretion system F family protein n=1 Tax=Sphingomonas sediminicola TaxID=386874 RepID=A0ABX6T8L5_9SPHN|nr:type II secretion system F family protein [Sphingomonas sediminicola]QNP46207.1 type II secretion system F family protein [Sphingomonas sediminicola]